MIGISSRRSFLGRLLALMPAWAVLRPVASSGQASSADRETLAALGEVVLPAAELGPEGVERALAGFERWMEGFEPEAELDHPYLWSDEIRYGPEDPRPAWRAQLEALELAARDLRGEPLGRIEIGERRRILLAQLDEAVDDEMPPPEEASHVAIALLAWYFGRPEANDLCYRRLIGRHTCRGLPSVVEEPAPLPERRPSRPGVRRRWRT